MKPPLQPIEIIGGGLAGLALGLTLQRAGLAVSIIEAGEYPRHRVCGEFITGLDAATITRLDLAPFLADAQSHREVAWFLRERLLRRQTLPKPALALSRHALDWRLAQAFVAAGGTLRTHTRADLRVAPAGRVFAHGRRITAGSPWIGLKCHARALPLRAELELHLGANAYVGLCAIENGRVNISGLFRKRPELTVSREAALPAYLRAAGLEALADRLAAGDPDPASVSAVAGLGFTAAARSPVRLVIGDTFALIPPFTGNGMAMAFQSAACAVDPLLAWARGERDWASTITTVDRRLRARFRVRLASARALHGFFHQPTGQGWLSAVNRTGLLPIRSLYRALH